VGQFGQVELHRTATAWPNARRAESEVRLERLLPCRLLHRQRKSQPTHVRRANLFDAQVACGNAGLVGRLGIDLDPVLLGGPHDPTLDRFDLVLVSIVFRVDVTPRRSDVLRRVDRVLVVGRVGEVDVAVLPLTLLRVDVVAAVDLARHGTSH